MTQATVGKTNNRFKATFKASRPHFMQKVVATQVHKHDAFNPRFHSSLTVFVPKLTPDYLKPCCFLNVANGNSSSLVRFESPEKLAKLLRDLADRIQTPDWNDKWDILCDIAEDIVTPDKNNNMTVPLDDTFIDVEAFKTRVVEDLEYTVKQEKPQIAIKTKN